MTGTVYNIQRFSIHDGPGIRTTIFLKGCPLDCWWCHNPESRSFEVQSMNGREIGQHYTPADLLEIVLKDQVFYDQSGGGITLSGGEPLAQPDFVAEILKSSKLHGLHTAVDTSGYCSRNALMQVLPYTDLFLYDLKLMDESSHLKYTAVSSKKILDNLAFLLQSGSRVIARIPMIPGITANKNNLRQLAEFISSLDQIPEINLLPYHRTAAGKYEKLGMKDRMKGQSELRPQEIEAGLEIFKRSGLEATIG